MIASVKVHDQFPDVIEVTDMNGARWFYRLVDGVMYPGRIWHSTVPGDGHTVAFFLPFPDGRPEVLQVMHCPAHADG